MINDVNNLPLRERGAVTKARPQQFYVCIYVNHMSVSDTPQIHVKMSIKSGHGLDEPDQVLGECEFLF